jgi:hypothetical protein
MPWSDAKNQVLSRIEGLDTADDKVWAAHGLISRYF